MIQEGDKTAETDATHSNSPEPSPNSCSNEQLVNLQKAIENGFTLMANSEAISDVESPKGRENETKMELLMKEISLQHDEKSSNKVSKANALESLKQELKIKKVGRQLITILPRSS